MSVERWRMTSGRVASIDLSGHPDAVQGARELLRMNGATRIYYAEPVQAFAGDEYDEARRLGALADRQLDGFACVVCGAEHAVMVPVGSGPRGQLFQCVTHTNEESPGMQAEGFEITSTPSKEQNMNENIIAETADKRETLTPIYSTADPRWGELVEWLRENADRITDDEGRLQASMDGENEALTPSERGWWHARYVLGVPREQLVLMDFDWPAIPDGAGEAPSWFKGFGPENGGLGGDDECPRLVWDMVLYDDETTRVDLWREDTYLPDSGEVVAGVDELKVWIDGESVELSGELATTAGLLRIVEGLTAALRVAVTL